ncbi:uncharacterized protein C5L36_0B02785 [Pichia kudriavzevii]|uniref:Uncharacterized protein n=2 Tax=Pichia kudriavzevii TaxID=4909 RepID=A0A2U9R117_PICKU|nr:uncharacterized protein C5L36_0B02785 [Pichia kudriavzevii]AWU75020.1 hypothetical protein C5L36_0B02785 [Pichia kudriavzevii]
MRSLPQPRYSRRRTLQRIFRSVVNLFSTGYVSDSSAFTHHTVLDRSSHKTRIRRSRVTGRPTPRHTVVSKLGNKLVSELIEDETIIANIVTNEFGSFATKIGHGGITAANDVNRNAKKGWLSLWKRGKHVDLGIF